MTEPLLVVDNLSVTFPQKRGAVTAVRGVSYQVDEGEFLGIVGESGSGKSVSSLAIMGLLPRSAEVTGSIRYRGVELLTKTDRELSKIRGSEIAMVFQDPLSALTPVYTIGKQIAEALQLHDRKLSDHAARARSIELLKTVGIPNADRRVDSFPHEFSGGMRQRVMIALAISNDPRLIIADEPTTALDVTIQAQVLEALQKAKSLTGAAVTLITHDMGVIAGNADKVAVMYAGRVVEQADVHTIFAKPSMPYTVGLLRSMPRVDHDPNTRLVSLEGRPPSLDNLPAGCPFAPRCPLVTADCLTVEPGLAPLTDVDGHFAACIRADEIADGAIDRSAIFDDAPIARRPGITRGGAPVLEVHNLARRFPLTKGHVFKHTIGTVHAVDGISFSVARGETLAIVGESGCGKSTTLMEIMELVQPQEGSIAVNGTDVATLNGRQRRELRRDIQIVFQDPMASLDPRLTIGEIVAEPLTAQGVSFTDARPRVAELLEQVGLDPEFANRYPHEFSGGQRQRIGIARALIVGPKVLLLDEPVSALDVSVQAGVLNLLDDLKGMLGLSYVFVTHDLGVVRNVATQVAVMYLGRIVEYGDVLSIFAHPRHPYTKALLSAAPIADPDVERASHRILLKGELPSPLDRVSGCNFRTRCPLFTMLPPNLQERCTIEDPRLVHSSDHIAACHYSDRTETIA